VKRWLADTFHRGANEVRLARPEQTEQRGFRRPSKVSWLVVAFFAVWFGVTFHKEHLHLNGLPNAFKRDAVEQERFLPPEVIEMKRMAAQHPSLTYSLDGTYESDDFITQHAMEYFYPIHFTQNSRYVFGRAPEKGFPHCSEIDRQPRVVMYERP
jgi:hypothetical protein